MTSSQASTSTGCAFQNLNLPRLWLHCGHAPNLNRTCVSGDFGKRRLELPSLSAPSIQKWFACQGPSRLATSRRRSRCLSILSRMSRGIAGRPLRCPSIVVTGIASSSIGRSARLRQPCAPLYPSLVRISECCFAFAVPIRIVQYQGLRSVSQARASLGTMCLGILSTIEHAIPVERP
jgi:hypothetical protein